MVRRSSALHTEARTDAGLLASIRNLSWRDAAGFLLELIYPPRCAGCGRIDHRWCSQCAQELDLLEHVVSTPTLDQIVESASTGIHSGVLQSAIQALKYEQATWMAPVLGSRMAEVVSERSWTIDMIVPVPLFSARQRVRGYNQSQLLGEIVAYELAIPILPQALTRQRETQSQVGLSADQRHENVRDAFTANPQYTNNQRILLIDDVHTTGATLSACASALHRAGAAAVYSLTASVAHF